MTIDRSAIGSVGFDVIGPSTFHRGVEYGRSVKVGSHDIFKRSVRVKMETPGSNVSKLRVVQQEVASDRSDSDRDFPLAIANITVSDSSPLPLYEQVCQAIRTAISAGDLPAGTLLPTGRQFSAKLGIARNTVVNAYARLAAEGYLSTNRRRGTRVSNWSLGIAPKKELSFAKPAVREDRLWAPSTIALGARARRLNNSSAECDLARESLSWTDPALYPRNVLGRLISEEFMQPPLAHGEGAALDRFQRSLAAYLRHMRGVQCEPAQIIPVVGFESALNLVAQVTIDAGDYVYLEDPTAPVVRQIMLDAGARIEFIKPDRDGVDIQSVRAHSPRLIVTSPSVSIPYGQQMSEHRRVEMLAAAEKWNCVLLECDSSWELSYVGDRLRALQGRRPDAPVVYCGSFAETLGSHIRVAYLIVPPNLVAPFSAMAKIFEMEPAPFILGALARFIAKSDYAVFVKGARFTYADRLSKIANALRVRLPNAQICEPAGGLRLVVRLDDNFDEWSVCQELGQRRIWASPLSCYFSNASKEKGIVLAFGNIPERDCDVVAEWLSVVLSMQAA